jgi:hypothetical protein
MSSLWDTAETLIAMTGDAEAAIAAARGMAEDCARGRRRREAAFWLEVAGAIAWLGNPQPLIAPEAPPAPGSVVRPLAGAAGRARPKAAGGAVVHRLEFAAKLPTQRANLARLKRKLRQAWQRHQGRPKPAPPPRKPEPGGNKH